MNRTQTAAVRLCGPNATHAVIPSVASIAFCFLRNTTWRDIFLSVIYAKGLSVEDFREAHGEPTLNWALIPIKTTPLGGVAPEEKA